jgi:hypothetical protein
MAVCHEFREKAFKNLGTQQALDHVLVLLRVVLSPRSKFPDPWVPSFAATGLANSSHLRAVTSRFRIAFFVVIARGPRGADMNRRSSLLWGLVTVFCLGVLAGCSKPGDGAKKPVPAPAPVPKKDISGS